MGDFTKVIRPGRVPEHDSRCDCFCKIEWQNGRLSITGVIGPKPNGDAYGGCGQILGMFAHRDSKSDDGRFSPISAAEIEFAEGWGEATWHEFLEVWERWHLNDMSPACEHQRALGWPEQARKSVEVGASTTKTLGWLRPDEHSEGLLTKPCPTCGYGYGTAWRREEVPEEVLAFLRGLPAADRQPAWV